MSEKLTEEEALKRYDALKIIDKVFTNEPYVVRPSDTQMSLAVDAMVTHGDLRAKEAVEKLSEQYAIMEREYHAMINSIDVDKHSYAARFAEWIALEDYIVVSESDLNVFWSKQTESVSKTTSQLLTLFNEHEQSKIKKNV